MESKKTLKPLYPWKGGKWYSKNKIVKLMPDDYDCYIEPFFGGGSVFLTEQPKKAILNDIMPPIASVWRWFLSLTPDEFDEENRKRIEWKNSISKADFYAIRDKLNEEWLATGKFDPRITWYLLSSNYGGVVKFRKNKGMMTSYGQRPSSYNHGRDVIEFLNNGEYLFLNKDYKEILKMASKDDFVFLDPPYYKTEGYEKNWRTEEYLELKNEVDILNNRGVKFMLTVNDDEYIKLMFKDYEILGNDVTRGLKNMEIKEELIIKNY